MVTFTKFFIGALPLLTTVVSAGKAPTVTDSPKNVLARAHLDKGLTKGVIEFSAKNGTVKVHIDTTGLPEEGGPFYYHIHKSPVPANGNCEATGTHLNPYNAPYEDCDEFQDDSYCQVGDLSGKHGYINTTCFETTYYDPFLSLNPKNKAYIVGLAVNLHFANMTKISCGTIEKTNEKVRRDVVGDFTLGRGNFSQQLDSFDYPDNKSSPSVTNGAKTSSLANGTALQTTFCDDANFASPNVGGLFAGSLWAAALALI